MEVIIKGAEMLERWAENKNAQMRKAMEDSVKVTAFSLRKDMVKTLRQGELGLQPTTQSKMNRKKSKNPLAKLAMGIIYKFNKRNLTATIGFHGDTARTKWTREYADRSDDGYSLIYTDRLREVLHRQGIHIRKTTNYAVVPARDIIGNFFKRFQRIATERLKENFRKKLRGERI